MARKNRAKRPKGDLERELREQLQLLQRACSDFDRGFEAVGKHIALSLRVLLHHHGQSRALLEQLGLRQIRFYDSAGSINPNNLLTECKLIVLRLSADGGKYEPQVAAGDPPRPPTKIPFVKWWNDPVLKDNENRLFNRRDLVQNVADTDGGAHVDPELDEAYLALSRENSLGWIFGDGNIERALNGRPELACMRQIAHEVLLTLREKAPQYFNV